MVISTIRLHTALTPPRGTYAYIYILYGWPPLQYHWTSVAPTTVAVYGLASRYTIYFIYLYNKALKLSLRDTRNVSSVYNDNMYIIIRLRWQRKTYGPVPGQSSVTSVEFRNDNNNWRVVAVEISKYSPENGCPCYTLLFNYCITLLCVTIL